MCVFCGSSPIKENRFEILQSVLRQNSNMIKCKVLLIQLISLVGIIHVNGQRNARTIVNSATPQASQDSQALGTDSAGSETGFAAGLHHHGGKYFQYAHNPTKDHYEFGHKRGNEHHFIERHEKAHPHEGEFKTKVRWGDKHGGYGEHYWDYNHDGHGHDGGEESQVQEQYVAYEEKPTQSRERQRRGISDDVEFIDETSRARILRGESNKHGGNYKRQPKTRIYRKINY